MRKSAYLILAIFAAAALTADTRRAEADADPFSVFKSQKNKPIPGKFTWVRAQYDSVGGYGEAYYDYDGRRWERWQTDSPEADQNFLYRLAELTTIDPNPQPVALKFNNTEIFNYPLVYMSDPGWGVISKAEAEGLRKYLLAGGMLWVDDFWGYAEWDNVEQMINAALPEYRWRTIPKDHPIMNVVFPMKECPQIPARDFAYQGLTYDPPYIHKSGGVEECHFRGWFDDKGRLMVVCTHNTDFGDGWERESEDEWYFKTYSVNAYAMGINIVVYALTH